MKSQTTIILGLACLGLLLYVYLGVWNNPGTTELERASREILTFKADDVVRVELKNANGNFVFSKKDNSWFIDKPIASLANRTPIASMLSELDYGRRMETIASSANGNIDTALEKYGLNEPRLRLDLKTATLSESILIGRPTSVSGAVYALLQTEKGREIVALDQRLEDFLGKNLDDWRSRDVLNINLSNLSALVLRNKGQDVEIRKGNDGWKISKPVVASADEIQVKQFMGDILRFRVQRFISEDNSAAGNAGLNTPSMVFDVVEGDKTTTLSIGAPDPDNANAVFASVSGRNAIFTLPKDVTVLIGDFLNRVRDRRIVSYTEPSSIKALSLSFHGSNVDLERESDQSPNWKIKGRPELVDAQKVDFILRGLERTRVSNFSVAGDPVALLKTPLGSMKLIKNGQKNAEELIFVGKNKDEVALQTPLQPSLVAISSQIFDNIPQSFIGWFSLNVLGLNKPEVDALSWKIGNESYGVHRVDTHSWKHSEGTSEVDLETLELQLKVIRQFAAARWLGPLSKKEQTKPIMSLQIKRGDGTDTMTFIREQKDQTVTAQLNDQECAFAVSSRDYQVLKLKPFKTADASKRNPQQ